MKENHGEPAARAKGGTEGRNQLALGSRRGLAVWRSSFVPEKHGQLLGTVTSLESTNEVAALVARELLQLSGDDMPLFPKEAAWE